MKRVVIKLSSSLLVKDQTVQRQWLDQLGQLIADLQKDNYHCWLVTSGAVALTKYNHNDPTSEADIEKGQEALFNLYQQAFSKAGVRVMQVVLAKEDFEHRKSYLDIRNSFNKLAKEQVVALINDRHHLENPGHHQFSDNDEIAGLVASLVDAERVILASTVKGVLKPDGTVIDEVEFGNKNWALHVTKKTSEHGKGGMMLKCIAAEHSAQRGVETIICDGSDVSNIKKAVAGEDIGTRFMADKRIRARKRWILDKKDFASGIVQVDDGLAHIIQDGKAASLLTVGIISVDGNFAENDIVVIKHGDKVIGYGETALDAQAAQTALANKTSKLLVHYDKYARIRG